MDRLTARTVHAARSVLEADDHARSKEATGRARCRRWIEAEYRVARF